MCHSFSAICFKDCPAFEIPYLKRLANIAFLGRNYTPDSWMKEI
jgi:hypothetical protein